VGRHLGYQIAFFMTQGLAATATMRLRPRGYRAVVWWAATLVFNIGTSALFLASLDEVVPFYAVHPPVVAEVRRPNEHLARRWRIAPEETWQRGSTAQSSTAFDSPKISTRAAFGPGFTLEGGS
jgi:hypothetical protein